MQHYSDSNMNKMHNRFYRHHGGSSDGCLYSCPCRFADAPPAATTDTAVAGAAAAVCVAVSTFVFTALLWQMLFQLHMFPLLLLLLQELPLQLHLHTILGRLCCRAHLVAVKRPHLGTVTVGGRCEIALLAQPKLEI